MSDAQSDSQIQLEGSLLLADPSLRDGIFDRSVILLADHTAEDGAFGLILNHPVGKTVGDLLNGDDFEALAHIPVHMGGPVSREHLTFSAFSWENGNLRCEIRLPTLEAANRSKQPGTLVRAFVGYTGWSAGQLETELRRQSWITAVPNPSLLNRDHDRSLWSGILRELSPFHRILAEAPDQPDQN